MTTRRLIDADITDRATGKVPVWKSSSGTHEYEDPTSGATHHGLARVVYPDGFDPQVNLGTASNLGTSGGSIALPIYIPVPMELDYLRYRSGDSATARSMEFGLFRDDGAADAVCVAKGSDSFTPTVSENRSAAFASAPVSIEPGVYWLVIRNTGGATNFSIFYSLAGTTNLGIIGNQAKTLASPLPAVAGTLDLSAGWTRSSVNVLAVALVGRVFGEGSAF